MHFISRSGKKFTLVFIASIACVLYTTFAMIPTDTFKLARLYCVQPIVEGLTQTALYTIPEMLLADVIDYDELVNGQRREGIFVVIDVNIMQLMDIAAGVLPGLILSAVGYRGNGGCSCGCGVKCPTTFLRWVCPGDIGYACTSDLSGHNPPFIGPSRGPPCTANQAEGVEQALQMFFFSIPAGCFLIATFFAIRAPIGRNTHHRIREELARRAQGAKQLFDPVTNTIFRSEPEDASSKGIFNIIESFSEEEQALAVSTDGLQKLYWQLLFDLATPVFLILGLGWVMHASLIPKLNSILIFVLFILLMQVVWQGLKLGTLIQSKAELKTFGNSVRFQSQYSTGEATSFRGRGRRQSDDMEDLTAYKKHLIIRLGEAKFAKVLARFAAWLDRARLRLDPNSVRVPRLAGSLVEGDSPMEALRQMQSMDDVLIKSSTPIRPPTRSVLEAAALPNPAAFPPSSPATSFKESSDAQAATTRPSRHKRLMSEERRTSLPPSEVLLASTKF